MICDRDELQQAVSLFTSRAAHALRRYGLVARTITVFLNTNRFREDLPQYFNHTTAEILPHSNFTSSVLESAHLAFNAVYRDGYHYAKAGIILDKLCPESERTDSLFQPMVREKHNALMKVLDTINDRFGDGTLFPASCGIRHRWKTKAEKRSQRYTTHWKELAVCYAK